MPRPRKPYGLCSKCRFFAPPGEEQLYFSRDSRRPTGLNAYCKECEQKRRNPERRIQEGKLPYPLPYPHNRPRLLKPNYAQKRLKVVPRPLSSFRGRMWQRRAQAAIRKTFWTPSAAEVRRFRAMLEEQGLAVHTVAKTLRTEWEERDNMVNGNYTPMDYRNMTAHKLVSGLARVGIYLTTMMFSTSPDAAILIKLDREESLAKKGES